ncbi:MAG: Na/Pi cotransporter family protein [Clostridia bacterium]|nr:Na/Pi cotransporter family protein [Clostridia bacterium]
MGDYLFPIITLLGGLAFFLYGMNVMSDGLEKLAGGKLESILGKMTKNKFLGFLFGLIVTMAIQSSSAVTVMLVGLVNSGIMKFTQTIGPIMGTAIGTTVTSWLLTLTGISGDNIIVKLLKPSSFAPILALIGLVLILAAKAKKGKHVGAVLIGFSVLMQGMETMSDAVEPLKESLASLMTAFENPILALLLGAIVTAIIQSSSASVGILQALAATGVVSYGVAIPIIMGQNIGTCITACISSVGANNKGKRVAIMHLLFKCIGAALWLTVFCVLRLVFNWEAFLGSNASMIGIAVFHTAFNVLTTLVLFPFSDMLGRFVCRIVKVDEVKKDVLYIDDRLLNTPSVAVIECESHARKMCDIAMNIIDSTMHLLANYDVQQKDKVLAAEDTLDNYEDILGSYLVKLSAVGVSEHDSRKIARMLHAIGNFERLGDHAVNLVEVAEEIHEKKIVFSDAAVKEIGVISAAVKEIMEMTLKAYTEDDADIASRVEPLEEVIDGLIARTRAAHIARLQSGQCTVEMGFVLSDLLANYERISDHCSNIAVAVIEVEQGSYEMHGYLKVRSESDSFKKLFEEYGKKYAILEK